MANVGGAQAKANKTAGLKQQANPRSKLEGLECCSVAVGGAPRILLVVFFPQPMGPGGGVELGSRPGSQTSRQQSQPVGAEQVRA